MRLADYLLSTQISFTQYVRAAFPEASAKCNQSRNKREGRYAGCYAGPRHVRRKGKYQSLKDGWWIGLFDL